MNARVRGAVLRTAAVLVLALGALATSAPVAGASGTHHALVVVEANGAVVPRVVTFTADSISGLDALHQAGFGTTVRGFGGMGAAVCAVAMPTTGQTVGCPADNTCLTCGGSSFWAYFEAPAGTSSFHESRAGASSTRVHDGDVEGWRWGTGDPPPYTPVAAVVGPPRIATPPAPPPAAPRAGTTAPRPTAPARGPAGPSAPPTTAAAPTTTTAPPPSTAPHVAVDARRAARHAAKAPSGGGSSSGSTIGYVVFGIVAAALGIAIVVARRARRA